MSYQVLKEDEQTEAEVPPYSVEPTPQGYMYVPVVRENNTATVVAQQPAVLPQVTVVEPKLQPKPAAMIFALVLTILCACHLFIPAFACLIPGLVFGIVGYSLSDSREQKSTAKAFNGVSLCCSISTIVFYVFCILATCISIGIVYAIFRYDDYYYGCWDDCHTYTDYNHYGSSYGPYEYDDYNTVHCQTVCS